MEVGLGRITHYLLGARGRVWRLVMCGSVSALLLAGCDASEPDSALLDQIAAGGDNQAWDEVRPALKAYMVQKPHDPLAHYLYGLSYLHLAMPQLTFAVGEFKTAGALLEKASEGRASWGGMSRAEFSGQIHRKTALAYMRGYREAILAGLPRGYCIELLRKANEEVEKGLEHVPNSSHLQEYSDFLREELGLDKPPAPEIITERAGPGIDI